MTRAAAVLAAVAAAGALAPDPRAAAAQSARYAPPPPDLDAERDAHSDFWEDAVEPGRARYDDLVGRAARHLGRRSDDLRRQAIELLEEAAALLPRRPDAWAWLGLAREALGDAAGCRDALEVAWAIDRRWRDAPRPVALALGVCRARTGDLDGGIAALEGLIARGEGTPEAQWRLGEAYMALGRLDEARAALAVAADPPEGASIVHGAWALAVAADRARDPEATAAAAARALRGDPRRTQVEQPPGGFLEPADADYYAGLAADAAGEPELALLRFRRYVAAAGEGPWVARAQEHVRGLRHHDVRRRVTVGGTDRPDRAVAAEAVAKLDPDLRACLADTPDLVVSLQITLLGPRPAPAPAPGAGKRRATSPPPAPPPKHPAGARPPSRPPPALAPPPPAGVRATVIAGAGAPVTADAPAAKLAAALACLEQVGGKLKLAPPTTPGTWSQVTVPLIAR